MQNETINKIERRIMRVREKPIEVEAFRFDMQHRPDWFQDKVTSNDIITYSRMHPKGCHCEIKTLEGIMTGNRGDWIIKGVNGEAYPCKNDIFEKTYDII